MNARTLALGAMLLLSAAAACTASQDLGDTPAPGPTPKDSGQSNEDETPPPDSTDDDGGKISLEAGKSDAARDAGKDTSTVDANAVVADAGPPVVPGAKRIFETSGRFSGDLKTEGQGASGWQGADNLCNGAALAAGLGGTWVAWISTTASNAGDRLQDVSPWYFVDRATKVFDKKTGLGKGAVIPQAPGIKVGPLVNININENGVQNSPINDWTGTDKTGHVSGFNCNQWTNNQSIHGYEGLCGIGIDFDITWWTDSATNPCDGQNRLICFEQ